MLNLKLLVQTVFSTLHDEKTLYELGNESNGVGGNVNSKSIGIGILFYFIYFNFF